MFRKLKRDYYSPRYIGITELHKNGNYHFHLLVFNLPFLSISQWKKYFPHGYIDIQLLKNIKNISAYFVKYMTKEFFSQNELNKKMYFSSRGLNRPKTLYKKEEIDYIINRAEEIVLISETTNLAQNTIKKYKLKL
jgi:hypothetical protein